jgi:uncharacterized protein YcaQ
MPAAILVSPEIARRFQRLALLLDRPVATVGEALAHLGYVQMDPINVCGRMHDLILRNRVAGYVEGGLGGHLHGVHRVLPAGQRTAFEHHVPSTGILVAFPFEAWPHLLAAMQRRTRRPGAWSGRLTPRERELSVRILAEIAARGPLSSDQIGDRRRSRQRIWGTFSLAKSTLQKLFFHGRLLIARRDEHNRRLYDLPERVLPPAVLAQPEPTTTDTARWEALLRLRQRRLTTLKQAELPLVADLVQPVRVEGCPPLYCLRTDAPLFDLLPDNALRPAVQLLAPLDPLIYDRRLTAALWRFDYTWEAYTPPAKRKRGHYALPVLAGIELVGHIDAKADRNTGRLRVLSRSIRRGHKVAPALRDLVQFLGLKQPRRSAARQAPAA